MPELHTRRFSKVLIANRGEIAMRILRACHELGLSTVAVYSDADRNAPHVRFADEAYHIGPAAARESYLAIEKIIETAHRSGADAIHPGYGFLAENAEFARACYEAGIVFVGPSPRAIEVMGDKLTARSTVSKAGVPVVPGTEPGMSDQDMMAEAPNVGFPLLVKASAGGGGKGMRPVYAIEDLADAIASAKREA
ncbi:MAG: biotin carboxylase N-terminal domain-containing protein, partial [Chloroflexota bacterium]